MRGRITVRARRGRNREGDASVRDGENDGSSKSQREREERGRRPLERSGVEYERRN